MQHKSVLLDEALDALRVRSDGVYLDGTFGRGGHSREILRRLGDAGRLLAFDKDEVAVQCAQAEFGADERFSIMHASFAELAEILSGEQLGEGLDGVLLDLGVSSPQLDDAARGFSFMREGPLDMRMDNTAGTTAADWLAVAEHGEIASVLKRYGEERFAGRIAAAIVNTRADAPLCTTTDLADLVARAVPKREQGKHPATRSFQAIRIFLNNELADLEAGLKSAVDNLKTGGRLVVISFHSLEDRIVKRFMRSEVRGRVLPRGVPVTGDAAGQRLKLIGKPVYASDDELRDNVRARSAVMRIAERI